MANSAEVRFKETDNTQQVSPTINGIAFIRGESLRGPYDDPSEIITSWNQFVERFGGLTNQESTILVKRLLDKGGQIRFSKIGHYTTIATASSLTATKAVADELIAMEDTELFSLPLKYPGADYNNIRVVIAPASNGITSSFNLQINHVLEPELNELYENLSIVGKPTAEASNYLQQVVEGSALVDVVYEDLSEMTETTVRPEAISITYENGSNGGAIVDADIIGDSSSLTGFYSFDNYDDSLELVIVASTISDAVHTAGAAYADMRKDLQYWIFLSNGLVTASTLIAKRASLNITTPYAMFFAGGLYVTDPVTSKKIDIEGSTDVVALALASDIAFGPWYSFAGNQRGIITNALGVVTNFGTPAKRADLRLLAQRQINTIINKGGVIKLWNLLSASTANNQYQFSNVVRGIIFIKKSIAPTVEFYIEEPNDIPTWKTLYYAVKPFLDSLVDKRALYSYRWLGDQDATSLDTLQINKKADVIAGKYKVKLMVSFIASMREVEIEIVNDGGNLSITTN